MHSTSTRSLTLRAKRWSKYALITACILFCLGGAVNSGWSRYAMAAPAAAALLWLAYRADARQGARCWRARLATIAFAAICVSVSTTQDRNPLLYPILAGGTVTTTKAGKIVQFSPNGSLSFREDESDDSTAPDSVIASEKTIKRYPAGTTFKVVRIGHSYADFGDAINLIVYDGTYSFKVSDYWYNHRDPALVKLSQRPVQHPVAKYLGLLMAWPVFPLLAMSLLN